MSANIASVEEPEVAQPLTGIAATLARPLARYLSIAASVVIALSLVRQFSGASDLTSTGTMGAALGTAGPLALAGLGGLWSERAGVVNIGLEGIMILGTFGGGWIGWLYGPWAGVAGAVVLGALGGLVHAVATVLLGVDHIVSGVAINILVGGVAGLLGGGLVGGLAGLITLIFADKPTALSVGVGVGGV